MIFYILIDYRGHQRKGVAIYDATQANLLQKPWFRQKKIFLNTAKRFKQEKVY
jgi:hypothetical protein